MAGCTKVIRVKEIGKTERTDINYFMANTLKMNKRKKILAAAGVLSGCYFTMQAIAEKRDEGQNINIGNLYLNRPDTPDGFRTDSLPLSIYEKTIKPITDKMLAFGGLLFLSPVFGLISLAVYLDDPGPVFFTQKRVGKGKEFFALHKFRSMRMDTPHDVPTHMLENPEQYITKVGKLLRKYSLDELPQIWDIFRGKMSVIGPRPALWNQEDLVAWREHYGANDVLPGLTGLAQIQGRDELEIADKARLDGKYVKGLHKGGCSAFIQDTKCILSTVGCVLKHEGFMEGGTGRMKQGTQSRSPFSNISPSDAGFEDYGYRKNFHIDRTAVNRKRVLITGAGSYIGESFERYAREHYGENFSIDTVDMKDPSWRDQDFTAYDAVLHVAGIAHDGTGKTDEKARERYYEVNTELAVETAGKARNERVKQFILMSSMIIYGESAPYGKEKVIDETTIPAPSGFYGDSKWQADKRVRELAGDEFHVAVLRPPMVYGRGSKGNYSVLAKLAKRLPVFPDVKNQRSMLYIDNLCEFLCLLILSGEGGVYFPQNQEYTSTTSMAQRIAEAADSPLKATRLLNPAVVVGSHMPGAISKMANKAFGNSIYTQSLSTYMGMDYQVTDLLTSIDLTEKAALTTIAPDSKAQCFHPLFSIITVCYNSEDVIEKTIRSVLSQTYPYVEYLIIDGASSDATVNIVKKYEAAFREKNYHLKICSEQDKGIYDAMNKGIKLSSGEIIGFINAGDWYEADAVSLAADRYEKDGFDYFFADINLIRSDGSIIVKRAKKDIFPTSRHWNHPSSFSTRILYEELGAFRCMGIHDDFEFYLRARKAGRKIAVVNKAIANFMVGGISNKKGIGQCMKRVRDRYKSYRINGYSPLYFMECIGIEAAKYLIS